MSEVWELYNMKIDAIAKQFGVTPQNDPQEVLKPHREKILREEMDLKNSEEFVTFPVVIIPQKSKLVPADDAAQKMQAFFVTWRKKRYDEGIIQKALGSMLNNPGHPGGLFMLWQFTYETGGKEATVMQSARNAAYKVITEQQVLNTLEPLRSIAEAKAKPFDLVKASEVLVANQFMYKEDLAIEVDKALKRTRQVLEAAQVKGVPALNAGGATNPVGGNVLQNFGFGQGTPQDLGTVPSGEPVIAGQPAGQPMGRPISFNG
jgi:hypothetical protein